MRHPIYNLSGRASFWGVAYTDWLLFLFAFGVSLRFLDFLPPRPKLFLGVVLTGLVVWQYLALKDRLQPRFFTHFANWSAEAEVYRIAPDPRNAPLVVDVSKVRALRAPSPTTLRKEGATRAVRGG